jgi:protein-S-isoprenylcysteine O-methyltransferase Ste14
MLAAKMLAWTLVCSGMLVVELRWGHRRPPRADDTAAELTDSVMRLATSAALVVGLVGSLVVGGLIEPQVVSLAAGATSGILGVVLRLQSMRSLGVDFALTPQVTADQQLVTSGLYRVVRHPGYSALLLFVLGLELIIGTWIALLSTLFVILTLPMRVAVEERILEQHFGDRYCQYRTHTPYRLLPRVY